LGGPSVSLSLGCNIITATTTHARETRIPQEWVAKYSSSDKHLDKDCASNFAALSDPVPRKGLLVTGVGAMRCMHDYTMVATCYFHPGERYGYFTYAVRRLRIMLADGTVMIICYDIACRVILHIETKPELKGISSSLRLFYDQCFP
jgi:hypothetical protein